VTSVYSGNYTTTAGANQGTTSFSYSTTATYAKTTTSALNQETNFQIANRTGVTSTGTNLNQTQTSLYSSTPTATLTGASNETTLANTFNLATGKSNQVAAFGKFSTTTGSAGTASLRLETSNNASGINTAAGYGANTPSVITGTKTNIVGTKQ
jgi:hypothetical protein